MFEVVLVSDLDPWLCVLEEMDAPDKRFAVSHRACFDSLTYSSAMLSLLHLPCRFKVRVFAPSSARIVAEVTLNECPV